VSSRVASRLSYEYVDGLNMIAMLLPGTPITLYGEEIGMEDAASGEHLARCVMSWSNATNAGMYNLLSCAYSFSRPNNWCVQHEF
jgi:glycosidase